MSRSPLLVKEKENNSKTESDNEKTEILYDSDKIVKRTIDDFYKIKEKFDNCTDSTGPSVFINTPIWKEFVNLKNRRIKLRFITEITKDNIIYCKELMKITDLRHLYGIKGNFGIADGKDYGGSASVKEGQPPIELIRSNVKTFVEQQQFLFETLWSKAIPAEQKIKEIEEGIEPIKTLVLQNPQDIFNASVDFYKKSNHIKFCSQIESLKIIYSNFFNYHQEILDRYRQGNHKGIKWITSLNNKKDIELVKSYVNNGIEVRHVDDLLTNSFALSDKTFLFTIEQIEKGKFGNNVLYSNDRLYIDHYDAVFENLWKRGIDIHDRIKDLEKGYNLNIETIPNPKESLKFYKEMLQKTNKEILIILASSSAFFRIEKNIGYNTLEELSYHNIKVKVLIPLKIELKDQINYIKTKYPRIEFRTLQSYMESFIGLTIIDKQRVLITEVKDDTKIDYVDVVGMTIYIEGKSTALSYTTIFNSLWKQTELYEKLEKAFEKIQIHEKMQKEFINIAAHELRTPIQPILGFTEHLKNKITDKEQLEFIDIVYRNAKKLKKLSENILDISKIENNLLRLNKVHFKIKELIQNILINNKKEAQTKNVEFDLIDSDNDFFIYADKVRINQVISNLICNSIKFTPNDKEGGNVSILVQKMAKDKDNDLDNNSDNNIKNSSNNNVIVISIKDNGVGIDNDILSLLFKKFISKSFQGTGLGLYICKNIIEAHGGKIWAKNNDDGKGATFSFSLPLTNNYVDNKDREKQL